MTTNISYKRNSALQRLTWAIGIFLSVVMLVLGAGCSKSRQVTVEIPESTFTQAVGGVPATTVNKDVSLRKGKTVKVILGANPTTGFKWDSPTFSDKAVASLLSRKSEPAKANPGMLGAGGTEAFVLKAAGKGATTATFEYSRPWAGGEKGARRLVLTITVK